MIAYIDTEVSQRSKQAKDFGAVLDDGAVLHTHSAEEFRKFILNCEYICGHNIINFDLKYANITGRHAYLDTLPLSPAVLISNMYPKRHF